VPKLNDLDVERNQKKIEKAAVRMFIRHGYHGTSIREIARECNVSVGNIYNYYPTKEDLFGRIVARYEGKMDKLRGEALEGLDGAFEADGLQRLAEAVKEIVYGNPDYWRLMYIDVVEFGNRHFAGSFRNLARNMKLRLGDRLQHAAGAGRPGQVWNGTDPALAFTAIYLQFFTYFLVEKLFGGKQHLGVSDDDAVRQLIQMITHGLWRPAAAPASKGSSA
jgi:AcrR family transcriptional regulator